MSDIPIGSPPAPPGRHAAPQGWYSDPTDRGRERYWDGWSWTRNTREVETPIDAGSGYGAGYAAGFGAASRPDPYGFQGSAGRGSSGQGTPGQPGAAGQQGHSGQQIHPDQHGGQGPQGTPGQPGPYGQQPGSGGFAQHPAGNGQQPGSPGGRSPYQPGNPGGPGPYPSGTLAGNVGPTTADGVALAGWGRRALAAIVDLICFSILASIGAIPVYLKMLPAISDYFRKAMAAAEAGQQTAMPTPQDLAISSQDQLLVTVIMVVVGLLYFGLFWHFLRGTPGQLLCGLRVVPVDHGHSTDRLPMAQALARAVTFSAPFAIGSYLLIFAALDAIWPLRNGQRQAVHDLVARTQVVRVR